MTNPLVGKIVCIDEEPDENGDVMCMMYRITAELGEYFFLAARLVGGQDIGVSSVISLPALDTLGERVGIYDSLEMWRRVCLDDDDSGSVVEEAARHVH